jgi:hypothetical protein
VKALKIKSKFVDASGVSETEQVLPPNAEGEQILEDVWLKSLYDLLVDSLRHGDDIKIEVTRTPPKTLNYVI